MIAGYSESRVRDLHSMRTMQIDEQFTRQFSSERKSGPIVKPDIRQYDDVPDRIFDVWPMTEDRILGVRPMVGLFVATLNIIIDSRNLTLQSIKIDRFDVVFFQY